MTKRLLTALAVVALLLSGMVGQATSTARADGPRLVFTEDFGANDGAGWTTHTGAAGNVGFADGMATIHGGGPENRILSRDVVVADSFTLDVDLFLHAGNTNAANKVGFFADAQASNRFQVTYNDVNNQLHLERVVGASATVIASTEPGSLDLGVNTDGDPHQLRVVVEGDSVVVSINGTQVLDVAEAGTASAPQGRLVFASQFPAQEWSIDNVVVTTTEPERTGEFEVTLQTSTNGVVDTDPATAGGALTANRTSGNTGDEVTLTHTERPGFVFDGYESFVTETGTSTDGLLTITNDTFTLDPKTGSVTIVAKFVDEPFDPNVLFKDYFEGELNDHGVYTISNPDAVTLVDGELVVGPAAPTTVSVDNSEWAGVSDYQVQLDVRKANTTAGTVHIAFRAVEDLSDRYVLALNGSMAFLRQLGASGTNEELARAPYVLDETSRTILVDFHGGTVSVSSDGAPVLSWTPEDQADWEGTDPHFAVLNLTEGAPVGVDNVIVRRTPVQLGASVRVTDDGAADPELASGAVVLSDYRTSEGSALTWTVHPKGGYAFESISFEGQQLTDGQLVVPLGTDGDIELVANFVPVATEGRTFFVDPDAGDDAASGLSPETAWASLAALDRNFNPGDEILLKRGGVWNGAGAALRFRGSGTAAAPIVVGAYGEGARPQLNGAGQVVNVVELYNQEYVHVRDLEITNTDPAHGSSFTLNGNTNRSKSLRAVNVFAEDFGVARGIEIRGLHIHDVNGNLDAKWNGGIFFDIPGSIAGGELLGVPTKYDDVLIADNILERVDRSGIKLVSSVWANQSATNSPNVPLNWYPSTNVVIRNNLVRHAGGDAITVRDTDGTLIEHNLARHSRYQNTGYNAGIWPFETTNTVVQHNEVSHTHGVQDGQGLDTDHVSAYSVVQYNYSHNNEGGFMLIMNGFPHTAPTIRYNISQNDADKTFEFARGTAAGTMIHNNTIYSDVKLVGPRGGVLDLANSAAGTGNREVFLFNNVFHYPAGQPFYVGEADTMRDKVRLYNNSYFGGISVPAEEEQAITADPRLPGLGTAPVDEAVGPRTGSTAPDAFAGYVPAEDSSLRNVGVSLEQVVEHYDGTITDRRHLSPTEIHALALEGESIDFAAGRFLPDVDGVSYDTDFLGNPLPDWGEMRGDEGITVGAVQYVAAAEPTPDPTEEPSGEPTEEPSGEPGEEPSQEPTPSATATVTVPPSEPDLYSTPGFHVVNGRWWYTACEPYSQTMRCRTEIWASQVKVEQGRFVQTTGWVFNNLTYLPQMSRGAWGSNPLANAREWTASDGRRWRTECDTAVTGRNGCRSWVWAYLVSSSRDNAGAWTHRQDAGWVLNNIVRFKA